MSACKISKVCLESPIGEITISACVQGIHTVNLASSTEKPNEKIPVNASKWEGKNTVLANCISWLQAYFDDSADIKAKPLPPFHIMGVNPDSFTHRVWDQLVTVPVGHTVSYAQLADMAGNGKASRAVGGAMRSNPIPLFIPCHRVITSSGNIGKYMSGKGDVIKRWLLEHEGAIMGVY